MHIPPGGGPPPHRHDFEEMFSVLEGEIETTSEENRPSFELAKPSTFQRTHLTNFKTRARNQCDCYACARRPGRKRFSKKSVSPLRRGQHRHPHSTRRPRQHSWQRSKLLPHTEPSFYHLKGKRKRRDLACDGFHHIDGSQHTELTSVGRS
jgi:Cupin domain